MLLAYLQLGKRRTEKKYLPDLLSGKSWALLVLTEPNAGTDASGQQTRAELVGDKWFSTEPRYLLQTADTLIPL